MSKAKFKFSAFDVIIVALVLAVIAYLSYTFFISPDSKVQSKDVKMSCVIEVKSVSETLADRVSVDDYVTVLENSGATVKSVDVTPAEVFIFDSLDGVYRYTPVPEKYDVIIEIETVAADKGDHFSLGESKLRSGTTIEVEGPGYLLKGTVLSINPETTESEVQ